MTCEIFGETRLNDRIGLDGQNVAGCAGQAPRKRSVQSKVSTGIDDRIAFTQIHPKKRLLPVLKPAFGEEASDLVPRRMSKPPQMGD